jgi:hypothetical protein
MPDKCFYDKFYEFFFKFELKWKKDVADIESYTKLTSFFDFFVTKVSIKTKFCLIFSKNIFLFRIMLLA